MVFTGVIKGYIMWALTGWCRKIFWGVPYVGVPYVGAFLWGPFYGAPPYEGPPMKGLLLRLL